MQQALYHPRHGYYASGRVSIGRRGDYFTSVSVGPLYGKLLSAQFQEMWERMDCPDKFTIVEQGANNGDFARDVLSAIETRHPDFTAAIRYVIIEPFAVLRDRQQEALAAFPRMEWHESLADLDPFQGVHFSNELVDAMPVHLVKFTGGAWRERYVGWEEDRFEFADGPLSSEKLRRQLEKLPPLFAENYTTEFNLDALDWVESLSPRLNSGYVLIADYGYPRHVYYAGDRNQGSLACYSRHARSDDPLQNVGERDITAHVDFTTLAEEAMASGFEIAGFTDQHHFMVGLGKKEFADEEGTPSADKAKVLREFTLLMHPNFMGMAFKFLALQKNLPPLPLAGFQFASNPLTSLDLDN
jgi:SAM-dependent MidA family methyltransferase